MEGLKELIEKMGEIRDKLDEEKLKTLKREYAKKQGLNKLPTNIQLLNAYHELKNENRMQQTPEIENILKKRSVRSMSGIVPVQVLTKPYPCPGECIFCPDDATMPKSYINTEPGAMRAFLNDFDPVKQVYNRLLSLTITGHNTDKIEMIILGGTWDVYPLEYKERFMKSLFNACNTFQEFYSKTDIDPNSPKSARFSMSEDMNSSFSDNLEEAQKINETSQHKIIGITIETRPEYVTHENCQLWRKFGVTRIEIGLQSLEDEILEANKRGHTVKHIKEALHLLRQYGFKFSAHFMPGLFKSTPEKDINTIKKAFQDPYIKPDEIKFYPTSVLPNTQLHQLYQQGEYQPLTNEELKDIIRKIKYNYIPPFTRIKRLIRDIPSTEIIAGSNITNLRQLVLREISKEMKGNVQKRTQQYQRLKKNHSTFQNIEKFLETISQGKDDIGAEDYRTYIIGDADIDNQEERNFVCLCTRCREVKNKKGNIDSEEMFVVRKYLSSVGEEYFLSVEDNSGYLYGFARLLLPYEEETVNLEGLGKNTAIIRELHVYGKAAKIGKKFGELQHTGIGGKIMNLSEKISYTHGYNKLSVISGIGVREYYKKLGYQLEGTYMVKRLETQN